MYRTSNSELPHLVHGAIMHSPSTSTCRSTNQFLGRLTTVSVSVAHSLTVLGKRLAVVITWHHAHTPAALSKTKLVAPTRCPIATNNRYSIRLFLMWSIHITILLAFTAASACAPEIIKHHPSVHKGSLDGCLQPK